MKKTTGAGIFLSLVVSGLGNVHPQDEIKYKDLLKSMTDLDWLWKAPRKGERCIQFSSYTRVKKNGPGDRRAWYANNDAGNFIRVEERNGKKEYVMVDTEGPGAVVRIWSADPKGTVYFYFDGEKEPSWEVPFKDLTSGKKFPFVEPIAGVRAKGANCYLPIPFSKHLKVTASDGKWLFYHFNIRFFPEGTKVEGFRVDFLTKYADAIRETARKLSSSRPYEGRNVKMMSVTAVVPPPVDEDPLPFPRVELFDLKGPLVVRVLKFRKPRFRHEGVDLRNFLRNLLLVVETDGKQTVKVPVSDFFGSSPDFLPYRSYVVGVTDDGSGYCMFPMPAKKRLKVALEMERPIAEAECRIELGVDRMHLPGDALAFHASWHIQKRVRTRPFTDHLFLNAAGPGRYVGCTLVVMNPVWNWWGEGDEKFFVDGEKFPSTIGTGTEDYFGYAWCTPERFASAYHAQTQVDGPRNFGFTCLNRFHIPDQVPFLRLFLFELEIWHWKDCYVDYASTAYWYGRPGASSGLPRVPDFEERRIRKIEKRKAKKAKGVLEGEDLKIVERTGGMTTVQDCSGFYDGRWSGGKQLWWHGARPGDKLTLAVPVKRKGRYSVRAVFTKANDYGVIRVWMNGRKLGKPIDLYNPSVIYTRLMDLGVINLPKGEVPFTIEIAGKNKKAVPKYMAGLDFIMLKKL